MRKMLLPLLLLAAFPGAAWAEARVGLRTGDHQGHGRVVLDTPGRLEYRVEETEGRFVLRFAQPAAIELGQQRRPRNVAGFERVEGGIAIALAPGARVRHFRLENRVVVDVLDGATPAATPREPRRAAPTPPPAREAQRTPPPARETPRTPSAREAQRASPAVTTPAPLPPPQPTPVVAPTPAPAPPPVPRAPAIQLAERAITIPARAEVGAALVRRGDLWLLVLDAPLPFDIEALRADPSFAGVELASGPRATVLRLPFAAAPEPRLTRERNGWRLEPRAEPQPLRSILPEVEAGPPPRLVLRAARPGEAVPVLDPETGATLLIGTVLEGGEATPLARRAAGFELLPTRLGAALLPRSDALTLRALPDRFVADGNGVPLGLGPQVARHVADAAAMSRHFDLPAADAEALWGRERNAMLAVAAAPALGRGAPRLRAAEALLALGLGQEAQAMAALAMREDPRAAADPRARALHAAAALVGGRAGEAGALAAPNMPETDEAALWRGLLAASRGEAAPGLAAGVPLLLAYPPPLRARLLPMAAEALAGAGEAAAARRLLATQEEGDPAFALARARLLEAENSIDEALAAYEAVARGRDRRSRAQAMRLGAELRLASGRTDAAGAATAIEATLAAWRGDALESEARSRLAELRMQAGDALAAFELLRETAGFFPEQADALRPRQQAALLAALEREPPVAAVTLHDTHAALLPAGEQTERALATLAERLAALDLVDRAGAALRGAADRASSDESRARIGARLAALALGAGDPAGARAALADTAMRGLPLELARERALLEARALARQGVVEEATARFREAGPAAAPELAEFLAGRSDWKAAAEVLGAHLAASLPAAPATLDDAQQRLVARHAALLALAGEEQALAALSAAESPRMQGGALGDTFSLLTGGRLAGLADLPRLARELEVARALPARLDGLREGATVAR